MTGVTAPPVKITYDLRALQNQGPAGKTVNVQWAIPEPTAVADPAISFLAGTGPSRVCRSDVGRFASKTVAGKADREL